jgi:pyridoxal phosphate enzyme (YggS family)
MEPIAEPELTADLIRDRYDRLVARLRANAERAGRDPDGVRVVAVTKGFEVAAVRAAYEAGLRTFGENRVQEALPKVEAVPDVDWHLVGRLQSNKVRPALGVFSTIHSVDSLDLLRRVERIAHDDGRRPQVLLQVNMSGEPTKAGFAADWFRGEVRARGELVVAMSEARHARVVGLMTIAAFGVSEADARASFARLRGLRDELADTSGQELPELSMGMTADADAAVAEGATLVRVGTAIFGPRPA